MRIKAHYHWLVGPRDIRVEPEDFDSTKVGEDEILCRTLVSAISPGTELSAFEGIEPLRSNSPAFPRWLGYMNVAEVVHAGAKAQGEFPAGSIVYSHAAHRSHYCFDKTKILAVLPRSLDRASASLSYLYRLAWMGLRRGRGEPGLNVAVVGLGAIGHCAIELLQMWGRSSLGISDHAEAKVAGERLGVTSIGRAEAEEQYARGQRNESELFDHVLVTTNSWRDWQIALSLARFNGIVSVIGFPGRGQPSPDVNPLLPALFYDKQLTIMSAGMANPRPGDGREDTSALTQDIAQILDWIGTGRLDPSRLIIGKQPASDLTGAYRRLREPGRSTGTIVLDWKNV